MVFNEHKVVAVEHFLGSDQSVNGGSGQCPPLIRANCPRSSIQHNVQYTSSKMNIKRKFFKFHNALCNTSGHRMHIKRNLLHCSALYYVWNRDVTFFGRDQNSEQLKRIETNFALHSLLFVGRRRGREILLRTSLIKHCCSVLKAPQWVHLKTILHWSSVNIKQYYWSTIIKHDFKALL